MRSTRIRSLAAAVAMLVLFLATATFALPNPAPRASWPGVMPIAHGPAGFRHFGNRLRAANTEPWHRAQDVMVRAGESAWVEARIAYGMTDGRLGDEDVDVYLRPSGARAWQLVGQTRTADRHHAVARANGSASNEAGLVSFRIPGSEHLPLGIHNVRMVVRGDRSVVDATIAVVEPGARVAVSDVDGTLTEYEHAFGISVAGLARTPEPHPGAAALLSQLAAQGYTVVYLTARPEMFSQATRAWLAANHFPMGLLRTREGSGFGMGGPDGVTYKSGVLRELSRVIGHAVDIGFGNTITDVRAYEAAAIPADRRYFYRFDGDAHGGVHHDDYRVLAQQFGAVSGTAIARAR